LRTKTKFSPCSTRGETVLGIDEEKVPFSKKLRWLSNLLGGSFLLAFVACLAREVFPWFHS
jgi:hypothetical protein